MTETHSTRIEPGTAVSTEMDADPRIAGDVRVGDEVVVEFDAAGASDVEVRATVTMGRPTDDGHAIGVRVEEPGQAPNVTQGDELTVVTGRDPAAKRAAPVLRLAGRLESPVGADARIRTPDASFDDAADRSSGWNAADGIAAEVPEHPMRG